MRPTRRGIRARGPGLALVAVLLAAAGSPPLAAAPAPALAQDPIPAPPVTVDGPSPQIQSLSGLSVARDGTGGLVYLKAGRVFVSRLLGGVFGAPVQVDSSLRGSSSQPVIAAGNGGALLIAFINGGQLYTVDRASTTSPYAAPSDRFAGAGDPALAMSDFGKGYLAFTAGGHDIRYAYYYRGRWSVESSPLNAVPAEAAGTGTGRPAVAAAGDGVGVVVWGEAGHVFSRRVSKTSPSVVYEQADVPSLSGSRELGADEPSVGAGGDSSYASVVFREVLSTGAGLQSRVLMNRLQGSAYDGVTQPDGLSTPGAESAEEPQISVNEYGTGIVTSGRYRSHALIATLLGDNGYSEGPQRIDSLQNAAPPYAVTGTAGLSSDLVAWQQDPGVSGLPDIRARYLDRSSFGPERVLSSPSLGPADAAAGLAAAGDRSGDGVLAWVQGTGSSTRIVAAELLQPPGSPVPAKAIAYARSAHAVLRFTPAHELASPVLYAVSVDGTLAGRTYSTSFRVPGSLSDGPHPWQVAAFNRAGETSTARRATIFVDTVAPSASLKLTGSERAGSPLRVYVRYADAPPPSDPPADASGIGAVVIHWGDGTSSRLRHREHQSSHGYRRPGRYRLTVTVADRAGHRTTVLRAITIARESHKARTGRPAPPPLSVPRRRSSARVA
ncbi:MAG: hypothetical protein M3Y17_13010 [Actinomycetota bacterium]|nr:hypothetical protein [Actinomycetota bacterium]